MKKFEYLVVFVQNNRVLKTNGHWQGEIPEGEEGDEASCPDKFEFLAQYYDANGTPLRPKLFANIGAISIIML